MEAGSPKKRTHHQATFAVLVIAISAYAVLQSLVTPVLPTIQAALHTNQSNVTWVLTAYLLSASICTPLIGRLGDIIGKKHVLVASLVALGVGSLIAALTTSIGVMIVARVIQGAGGAVLPLSFGIVRDEFRRDRVATAVGSLAGLIAVGGGLGIVLAGPIVDAFDFHYLFWFPLILVVIAIIASWFIIPESPVRTPGKLSFVPAALLTLWLVALLVAVSESSSWGWGSGKTLGLIAIGLVLIPLWILAEVRSVSPVVDMRMMRIPAVWTTNLVALLLGIPMYATMAFLPEFLQTPRSAGYGFGASVTQSGLFIVPMTAVMFVFGLLSGRWAERVGAKIVSVVGMLLVAVSMALLTFAHHDRWEMYVVSSVLGAGLGFAYSAVSFLIVEAVPPAQVGVASGMNSNIRTVGGSIGAAVMGTIVTSSVSKGSSYPHEAGYTRGFLFLLIASLLAAGAGMMIPVVRRKTSITEEKTLLAEEGPLGVAAATSPIAD